MKETPGGPMKLTPKKRLHLGKQTVRTLLEDDLAKAQGGIQSADCRTGATALCSDTDGICPILV